MPKLQKLLFEIEQTGHVRIGQDAHRTRDAQMPAFRFAAARQIVYQEAVRLDRQGERDVGALAGIEKGECGIGGWIGANLTPSGRLRDPGADRSRCVVLL